MYNILYAMSVQLKVNMAGYDYTGYGWSKSVNTRATEKQTYKDIESVYNWLIATQHVVDPEKNLIIYGQSVGSGPSTYLAVKQPCAGLVLHSPILSGKFRLVSCAIYSAYCNSGLS
jgi:dienelactone hydrolase